MLQITALTNKREEAIETMTKVEPQLNVLLRETKQMQKQVSLRWHHVINPSQMPHPQVANEISKKYNNRPVNIIGEINSI